MKWLRCAANSIELCFQAVNSCRNSMPFLLIFRILLVSSWVNDPDCPIVDEVFTVQAARALRGCATVEFPNGPCVSFT